MTNYSWPCKSCGGGTVYDSRLERQVVIERLPERDNIAARRSPFLRRMRAKILAWTDS